MERLIKMIYPTRLPTTSTYKRSNQYPTRRLQPPKDAHEPSAISNDVHGPCHERHGEDMLDSLIKGRTVVLVREWLGRHGLLEKRAEGRPAVGDLHLEEVLAGRRSADQGVVLVLEVCCRVSKFVLTSPRNAWRFSPFATSGPCSSFVL